MTIHDSKMHTHWSATAQKLNWSCVLQTPWYVQPASPQERTCTIVPPLCRAMTAALLGCHSPKAGNITAKNRHILDMNHTSLKPKETKSKASKRQVLICSIAAGTSTHVSYPHCDLQCTVRLTYECCSTILHNSQQSHTRKTPFFASDIATRSDIANRLPVCNSNLPTAVLEADKGQHVQRCNNATQLQRTKLCCISTSNAAGFPKQIAPNTDKGVGYLQATALINQQETSNCHMRGRQNCAHPCACLGHCTRGHGNNNNTGPS